MKELLRPRDRRDKKILAAHAEQWLRDPTVDTAIATIRQATITAWIAATDREAREECHRRLQSLNDIVMTLRKFLEDESMMRSREKKAAARVTPS